MKKIISFILTTCIIISLVSAIGSIGVSAANGDLLFDMDFSGFNPSISGSFGVKGKTGYGEDCTVVFGGYSSEVASKRDYINANGDTVEYINFTENSEGGYNFRVDVPELANMPITAEFWVRTKAGTSRAPFLAFLGGTSSGNELVNKSSIQSDYGYFYLDTNNGMTQLSDTKWQHVAFVREKSGTTQRVAKLYVNGELKSSKTYAAWDNNESTATFYLTRYEPEVNKDNCPDIIDLASLKLYEGALSAEAIKAHHDAEASDYTEGWSVDVDFKNTEDSLWGLAKGGNAVVATDTNVPSNGAVTFTNSANNFNASRDEDGYLKLAVKTPNSSSSMRMGANMPTALKCGTYEMEFSAYYPDQTAVDETIRRTALRFGGTIDYKQVLMEFGVDNNNNKPAIEYSSTWKDNVRNSDNEFIVKAIISSPSPTADWTVELYNVNKSSTNPERTMTIGREVVGDLNGAEIYLYCDTAYSGYKNTNTKIGYIKANYNPYVISGISITDSDEAEVTDFTGVQEINYDADVYGGKANVVVALYDGDTLEAARVHTFDGINDITGTFSNLDITGKGEVKVFMISKDFGKLVPKCKSFTYGE